jgi:CRP/FNR family transcriptional regulator
VNNQEAIIREKLSHYYANVFEEELIDEIVRVGYFDKIKSGKLMIDIGENMTHIPLILDGVIKVSRQEKEGEELVLYFLERGDTCAISFVNCINRKKSILRGIVEQDMEAIFLPVEYIDNWLAKFKTWRYFIIDSYHYRLIEMVESIDSLAFMKMNERLMKYLTDKVKITKDVNLEITHQEIANDLNSSRVVITRLIKELHNKGKIVASRNKIRVLEGF